MATAETSAALLTPSQIQPPSASTARSRNGRGVARRRGAGDQRGRSRGDAGGDLELPSQTTNDLSNQTEGQSSSKPRKRKPRKPSTVPNENGNDGSDKTKTKVANQSSKRPIPKRPRKKYPWRQHIPPGSMDPITLDPLVSLPYPPFALAATEPYIAIKEWPVPEVGVASKGPKAVSEDERQRRILEEQWGDNPLLSTSQTQAAPQETAATSTTTKRHYNLFDGRALAYYLVSQLQFIDPFNRRDLTRDELVQLDAYLTRHGFNDLKVVEAYDAKGVTLSTAGAVGNTAAGRAAILQQEAQVLLNALFAVPQPTARSSTNRLQQLYAATEASGATASRPPRETNQSNSRRREVDDTGIYGTDDNWFVVIDDDENPGLRGGIPNLGDASSSADASTLQSASHSARQQRHAATVQAQNFPALPTPTVDTVSSTERDVAATAANSQKSRSLLRITNVVAKTDPAEIKRQKEAREEAQRRALLANLSFTGIGTASLTTPSATAVSGQAPVSTGPTEAQLLRNQTLASALGVAPMTVRRQYNEGWARPTDGTIELDEFGNELNAAQYPDALILQARERMDQLLKLEKRWKTFLADDSSASLPLNSMDRPLRTFVHEYSDFWKLHTESFDPEPKRYIHCVKLRDTSAPVPLLSDAARRWRGPTLKLPRVSSLPEVTEGEHALSQTAGQATLSREFPPGPPREPLKLKPRSAFPVEAPPGAMFDLAVATTATVAKVDDNADSLPGRFESLAIGRERPKLDLAPRTVPLELPPFQKPKGYNVVEERERQASAAAEKARKEREEAERKKKLLIDVFASSDEEDESQASSDWEEPEALYSGSDTDEAQV